MISSKLFTTLPDYVCTPDGMAIDWAGRLIVSCPNYADDNLSGCVIRIDKAGHVEKWFDVPVHPLTGIARNMGIAFDRDWNLYLCDNQGWSGKPELQNKGRILRVHADEDGQITECVTVATNMEHPNGIRIRGDFMYVTESCMTRVTREDGLLTSGVYRFALTDREIDVHNDLSDPNLFASFVTHNPECQYGMDGIIFDRSGDLLAGNFGDGEVFRMALKPDGSCGEITSFARDPEQLQSTDGMIEDEAGNLYIADFSANAVCRVSTDGKVERIAQSPDCNGFDGGLDQPGEPILWDGKLILSCFDLVTGPDKVNLRHSMPAALVMLEGF